VFRREVAEDLVNRTLLVQEAGRRGLRPDEAAIEARLDTYRQRMRRRGTSVDETSKGGRALRRWVEQQQLVEALKQQVRRAVVPTEAALKAYYEAHPEKFTEPEQVRVSLILLKVDPSSPAAVWQAARREAAQLVMWLRAGEDFAELARLHSGHASAARGGDMGYVHQGMLAKGVEDALANMKAGAISDPVTVLEGMAIARLDARRGQRRHSYEQVRERARGLWQREQEARAWEALIVRLRATTPIEVDEQTLTSGSKGVAGDRPGETSERRAKSGQS
jgi:parvulin-like peptidyl-prolyl isomerase